MKIGIDIRTLMDEQYSGVSEYTLNLIKEMIRLDADNEYQLFYNCLADIDNRLWAKVGRAPKVKLAGYHYPNKVLNYLLFKFFNYPKIDKELGLDAFFMPHINFIGLTGGSSFSMPATAGPRKIITVHDLSFLKYPEFFSWRNNFWHKMINVKKLLKRFDLIATVSENTKRDIVMLCDVNPDKVKVIYSGVGEEYRKINFQFSIRQLADNFQTNYNSHILELNAEEKKLVEVKKKYNLPDKFILYLGTVEPRKNVDGLIRAYNEFRTMNRGLCQVKLVVAGSRGWKSGKAYQEWQKSEYKDDIIFTGYIEPADKVCLYNLATVFIYPSFMKALACRRLKPWPAVCRWSAAILPACRKLWAAPP